jgi:hypothetical protein
MKKKSLQYRCIFFFSQSADVETMGWKTKYIHSLAELLVYGNTLLSLEHLPVSRWFSHSYTSFRLLLICHLLYRWPSLTLSKSLDQFCISYSFLGNLSIHLFPDCKQYIINNNLFIHFYCHSFTLRMLSSRRTGVYFANCCISSIRIVPGK